MNRCKSRSKKVHHISKAARSGPGPGLLIVSTFRSGFCGVRAVPDVVIYTRPWCSYCRRAKVLLESKRARYDEIDVQLDPQREREMIRKAGGRSTVPQIFVNGRHVGGSDELHDLDRQGRLDELLGQAPREKEGEER